MNTNILVETFIERIDFERMDYKREVPYTITNYLPLMKITNKKTGKINEYLFGDIYFDGEGYCMINFDGLFATFSYICLSDIKYVKNKARKNSIKSLNELTFLGNYFKMSHSKRNEFIDKAIRETESRDYYVSKSIKDIDEELQRVSCLDFFLKGGTKKQNIYAITAYYNTMYDGIGDELTTRGVDINKIEIDFCINLKGHDEDFELRNLDKEFYVPIGGIYTENNEISIYSFINELGEVILMSKDDVGTYESFMYDFINGNKSEYIKKMNAFNIEDVKHPAINAIEFIYYLDDLIQLNNTHFS